MNHSPPTGRPSSSDRGVPCQGPYGGRQEDPGMSCPDVARFEIVRHDHSALLVCPVHLGPSLLMADRVLWPPQICLIG
ncbi:hypothetical protein G3I71_11210 [Streptomyces sp. SID12501]|uniref:Uncharacterized protein n=1 Tax=Streptomyces sp. SID12501 TaxID=2706042 RepID=A0A6B3BPU3_9ACTN|nr:hypothetical protein [Streptomyces sp. SID12501]